MPGNGLANPAANAVVVTVHAADLVRFVSTVAVVRTLGLVRLVVLLAVSMVRRSRCGREERERCECHGARKDELLDLHVLLSDGGEMPFCGDFE